jgi:hypothetical protein
MSAIYVGHLRNGKDCKRSVASRFGISVYSPSINTSSPTASCSCSSAKRAIRVGSQISLSRSLNAAEKCASSVAAALAWIGMIVALPHPR